MSTIKQTVTKGTVALQKQRSYSEIVEFLEKNWATEEKPNDLERMKQLDALFSHPSQKLKTIIVGGTNGKSLTAHFIAKLLKREGLKVGVFLSPHIMTYNERISSDNETVSNKLFTELTNEVINAAHIAELTVTTREVLTQTALNYFVAQNVDVAILEAESGGKSDTTALCKPSVTAITRLIGKDTDENGTATESAINEYAGIVVKGSYLASADQNKTNLKHMNMLADKIGAHWAMPVRKLVTLTYPFEQLHGRCGALAERAASLFINHFAPQDHVDLPNSILIHQKGQRGRPTLETKKQLELNPKKTTQHFWKDTVSELHGRFQVLDKERPSILLDNAHNIDSFENLLLGIRLLHYQKPIKGLALIIGCENTHLDSEVFSKQIRYFFKKITGHIIICPLEKKQGWQKSTWDTELINNALKSVKVKARVANSFDEAFETAKKLVNDRNGLIAIAGSSSIIKSYWDYKGIKKL